MRTPEAVEHLEDLNVTGRDTSDEGRQCALLQTECVKFVLLNSEILTLCTGAQRRLSYLIRRLFSLDPLSYISGAISKRDPACFSSCKENNGFAIHKTDLLQIDGHFALFLAEQITERIQSVPLDPATQTKNHSTFSGYKPSDSVIHHGDMRSGRFLEQRRQNRFNGKFRTLRSSLKLIRKACSRSREFRESREFRKI
jgi:hypothetical protein